MASLGDMFVTVGAKIDGFEKAMGTVGQRLRAIDRDVNKTFGGFDRIGDKMSTLGTAMSIGVTAPLAIAGGAVTKFAADFDLGMRKVTSLMGGDTAAVFKSLSADVLKLSREMGIDAVGATNALYEAISAGVPKENAIDFLRVASTAAIAGVTETNVAVNALTTVLQAYNLETSEAKNVSDAMFQAVNIGKMTFPELAGAIGITAGTAKLLGVEYQELLAASATLTLTTGQGVSESMTMLQSAMKALIEPSKEMAALLAQAGYESGVTMIKTEGLEGSLQKLWLASGQNVEVFEKAFGRIEGFRGAVGLTGDNAVKAAEQLSQMRHATDGVGAATAAYNEINKSTSRQFEMAVQQIKATAIELGSVLLPTVNNLLRAGQPLIQWLTDAVTWFTKLPEGVQLTALGFTAAVAVIGPLVLALGTIISTISQVSAAFVSLAGISGIGAVVPALAQLPAMLSNVSFAVTNGLAGALTGGELMLLRFGQAALVAAAAFAGWKLGEWAYSNVPGVSALGDAISDLGLKIPLLGDVIRKVTGIGEAEKGAAEASEILRKATDRLESELKKKGITVDKTGKTFDEYRKALIRASAEANKGGQAHSDMRKEVDKAKALIEESQKKAKAYSQAQKELGLETKQTGTEHQRAASMVRQFQDGIPSAIIAEYERKVRALRSEIAKSTIEHQLAVLAGKDFESQLNNNIGAAQRLSAELMTSANQKMPTYVAGLGKIGAATRGLTEDLDMVVYHTRDSMEEVIKEQDNAAKESARSWDGFSADISRTFSELGTGLIRDFITGEGSFGERFKRFGESLLDTILGKFIQPATEAIGTFISNTIADLLSGKGLGGVIDSLAKIGSSIAGIFGAGTEAAASTAGNVAGAAIPGATGAAGSIASSSLTSIVGAVSGVVSAISDVFSNFQFAAMNKTLDLIENYTRYTKIWTGEQSQSILWSTQTTAERLNYVNDSLDVIGRFASDSLAWLERIGRAVESSTSAAIMNTVNAGGVVLNVYNPTFSSRDDIDYLLDKLAIRMRETGQIL